MLLENQLNQWVNKLKVKTDLPLRFTLWNGKHFDFGTTDPDVTVKVKELSTLTYLLNPSLSNLGTAYVEEKIDVEGSLTDIINLAHQLAHQTLKPEGKLGRLRRSFNHSRKKDAESIQYHYDVSNDFYKLWLDENMVYSCAYFKNSDDDLDHAQLNKIDHILKKINLQPGQTLLDIGCGWGALVLRAAEKFGAKCVGVTLSENQYALAQERIAKAGLSDRVEVRIQDYRDISGEFDRITSVGMFEHVGRNNLPAYFSKIKSLLKDDGIVMNHGITSTDHNSTETPYGGGEFIHKYVFPQGELPHISLVLNAMQQGGLEVYDVENLRHHYAKTCQLWAENFERQTAKIKNMVTEQQYRIWRVYLAGCSYAFMNDLISIFQVVGSKGGMRTPILPMSRKYMYTS